MDYFETFSVTIKHTYMRLFVSFVVSFDWPFCQLNVKNAFIHGDLLDKVYMKQSLGGVWKGLLVKISLYGLK